MRPTVMFLLRSLGLGAAYAALNLLSARFEVTAGVSMVFPASALGVAAAMVWRTETALAVFAATLLTPWQSATPLVYLLFYGVGNVLEALLPSYALRSRRGGRDLGVAGRFILWACLANTALNFVVAHAPQVAAGAYLFDAELAGALVAWTVADGMAIAIFATPAILALRPDLFVEHAPAVSRAFLRKRGTLAVTAVLVVLVSAAIYVFDRGFPGAFNWPAVFYLIPLLVMLMEGGLPAVLLTNAVVAAAYLATLVLESRFLGTMPFRSAERLFAIYGNLAVFLAFSGFAGAIRSRNEWLVARLKRRWARLRATFDATVTALAAAVEAADPETLRHLDRVRRHCVAIAKRMGLSAHQVDIVQYAALLHDVGKIGVSQGLITKPGPLDPNETAAMQRHVELGAQILERSGVLPETVQLVRYHEERWDGSTTGRYPGSYGLAGEAIPIGARIIAVADAFDAMVSDRSYRKALGVEYAAAELKREAGRQFDPEVVRVFLEIVEEEKAGEPAAGEPQLQPHR
ncbi:MAG: HD domain-containing protein [Gemmatimonadetes bacterium]|nr:HD domain-containing protein [Gemmatimonadota bacterium]